MISDAGAWPSWSKAIQVISRSGDDTALQLTDALVLRLARVADAVKCEFGGRGVGY